MEVVPLFINITYGLFKSTKTQVQEPNEPNVIQDLLLQDLESFLGSHIKTSFIEYV